MNDYIAVALLLALLCSVCYILWLHMMKDNKPSIVKRQQLQQEVVEQPDADMDNMSFLKSQYDYNFTKGDEELLTDIEK